MDIPENICNLVIEKMESGLTQRTIAAHLNIPQSTVSTVIQRFKRTGKATQDRVDKCGRNKLLSERDERAIRRESVKNPLSTAREIRDAVGGHVQQVSLSTVKRCLRREDRISYRPVKSC